MPHCERLAPTEKLFVTPWYCSLLPDQSLALNRRRDDEGELKTEDLLDRQVRARVTWFVTYLWESRTLVGLT